MGAAVILPAWNRYLYLYNSVMDLVIARPLDLSIHLLPAVGLGLFGTGMGLMMRRLSPLPRTRMVLCVMFALVAALTARMIAPDLFPRVPVYLCASAGWFSIFVALIPEGPKRKRRWLADLGEKLSRGIIGTPLFK